MEAEEQDDLVEGAAEVSGEGHFEVYITDNNKRIVESFTSSNYNEQKKNPPLTNTGIHNKYILICFHL